ncbi:MAG TPA: hydantoinase/oxoprolinase family protein [Actinophytocola sp.]|jgi:N-methylhydantoinase A|nr:hydantoinase/oxoprolinase family protein [Actinophytocola sp.]
MSENRAGVEVAVDIGGTFTDVVLLDAAGAVSSAKILSTPPDFEAGVLAGLTAVLAAAGRAPGEVGALFHGMTVATNAVLERRGARTALVTTAGFRDILEIARSRRPDMYDLRWKALEPLVPRRRRFEVDQRITATGELDPPVAEDDVRAVADRLRAVEPESVAVCLINSYLRPDEERGLTDRLRNLLPGLPFTASVDVSATMGEYERTSTAVVNAYVAPAVERYLSGLTDGLAELGVRAPLSVMQSSGGLLGVERARRTPVHLIESGPAAGVIATLALADSLGEKNVIAFDMGGTTAKATLIEDGEAFEAPDFEVGAGMNTSRGLNVGAGHAVVTPTLDIAEVGAGGGSVIWVDAGGAPRVGPRSAGAFPGPASYGRGGELPTLSDAALVLGYLNPGSIAGGTQQLRPELAHRALAGVAGALGVDVEQAAYGAVRIAVSTMTRLLKEVTSERGRDPRDAVLAAFGGAGPAYGAVLAQELGIRQVIVPPTPGLFSAVGLLAADPRHDEIRPCVSDPIDAAAVRAAIEAVEREVVGRLVDDGYPRERIAVTRAADMRYAGQRATLRVPVPSGDFGPAELELLLDALDDEHYVTYGHRKARTAAEVVNVCVRATCRTDRPNPLRALAAAYAGPAGAPVARRAYFGQEAGWLDTPVLRRADLSAADSPGPAIIEDPDSTIVVPPDVAMRMDNLGNVILSIK